MRCRCSYTEKWEQKKARFHRPYSVLGINRSGPEAQLIIRHARDRHAMLLLKLDALSGWFCNKPIIGVSREQVQGYLGQLGLLDNRVFVSSLMPVFV